MQKRLYRSTTDRFIAGVCGGLGDYFDIDSAFVRLLFVIAAFTGGLGIIAYIVLAVTVPEAPEADGTLNQEKRMNKDKVENKKSVREEREDRNDNYIGGSILVTIGAIFLANNFLPGFSFGQLWPLVLVAIGIGLLTRGTKR
jgi:phage shock protein C